MPGRPCPFRRRATLGLSGNPLRRGGRRPGWSHWVGRLPSRSRFTIHMHIPPRASAGGRQVAFGFTIHDSHSHPPRFGKRKAEQGKRKTEVAFTIHDSHSHPPRASAGGRQVVGRLPSGSRFTIHIHIPHERRPVVGKSALADSPTRRAPSLSGFVRVSSPRARGLSTPSRLSGRVRWFSNRRLLERSGHPASPRGFGPRTPPGFNPRRHPLKPRRERGGMGGGPDLGRLCSGWFGSSNQARSAGKRRRNQSKLSWSPDRPWHPRMPSLASP